MQMQMMQCRVPAEAVEPLLALQVVCTIHQPSSDITERFDDLMLLAGGRVVYSGAWNDAVEYFARQGYP